MPKKEERFNVALSISEILTLEHLAKAKINNMAVEISKQGKMSERTYALKERIGQYDRIVTLLYKARTIKRTKEQESLEYLTRTLGRQEIKELRSTSRKNHRKRSYH